MKLYILRHAIAAPRSTANVQDDARPLTEEGIRKMKKAAAGLKSLGLAPEVILSSPLERAKQTADIVRGTVGALAELRLIPALSPTGHRDDVFQEIREYTEAREVMLIGHQPSLGEIAGEIAFRSAGCFVELRKGGICAIELDRLAPTPRGTLLWLLTPSVLRSLR